MKHTEEEYAKIQEFKNLHRRTCDWIEGYFRVTPTTECVFGEYKRVFVSYSVNELGVNIHINYAVTDEDTIVASLVCTGDGYDVVTTLPAISLNRKSSVILMNMITLMNDYSHNVNADMKRAQQ